MAVAVLDDHARPDPGHHVGFGDDPSIGFEHCLEQVQCPIADGHGLAIPEQFASGAEHEWAKAMRTTTHGQRLTRSIMIAEVWSFS
jgi:hypothetical protein